MKFVDFNDERIPIGKRKVAYVKYAMAHGTTEKAARMQANRKFGFERKGKYLVLLGNAHCMDLPSFRNYTWEQASCIDCRKAESVIIVCDEYYAPFDICKGGLLSENTMFGHLPPSNDWREARKWAEENEYKVSTHWLCP